MNESPDLRDNPHRAGTLAYLAHALGVTRNLITLHRRKPGAPKLADLKGWQEFLAAVGRDASMPADLRRPYAEARLRKMRAEAAARERENQVRDGELIEVGEACAVVQRAFTMVVTSLERVFCGELPADCKGRDELGIRTASRAAIDAVKAELVEQLKKFKV